MQYILLVIYLAIALALQFLTGNIPVAFLAFPLNLIVALIWEFLMLILWRTSKKSLFVEFMLSRGATITSIVLLALSAIVIGITGDRSLVTTWIFAAILLYFQTVLLFVILRGWREQTATGARLGQIRWRFLFNHLGILLAVSSAFWGAPDTEVLRMRVFQNLPVREAMKMDGTLTRLPYEITLDKFDIHTYSNGVPSMYEAMLMVDGKPVVLKVNEPYSVSFGRDLYLVGFDGANNDDNCILQLVYEPWRYAAMAGIELMLIGAFLLFATGPRRRYNDD